MLKTSVISKVFLTIFVFGFILWFGGSVLRSAVAFDLFVPAKQLTLKSKFDDATRLQSVRNFALMASYTGFGYGAALFASLFLIVIHRKSLKARGWLFMAFILFFIAVPIELYFLYMDIKLSLHIFYSKTIAFNDYQIHKFFVSRFGNVLNTTFSGLSFLANITAILYLIWKPLDKSRKVNPVSNTLENMDTAKAVRTNES